jgi:hypothetical protein
MAKQKKIPPLDTAMQRATEYARLQPGKAVAAAFGAGLLLTVLPLRPIAAGLLKAAFSFLPPALLLIGLRKARACCCAQDADLERP